VKYYSVTIYYPFELGESTAVLSAQWCIHPSDAYLVSAGSTAAPFGAVVHPLPMASSGHAQHHVAGFLWLRLLHSRPLWDGGVFLVVVTLQLPLLLVIMISGGDFLDQLLMFCLGTHAHKVE